MQYYHARRNVDFSSPLESPLESPIYGVVDAPELLQAKVQLCALLSSGQLANMPAGFPFRRDLVPHSKYSTYPYSPAWPWDTRISTEPYEFREDLRWSANKRCSGTHAAYISFHGSRTDIRPGCSNTDYLHWTASLPKVDWRPYSHGPPAKSPVAHARVDVEVMRTAYGKYIERDPSIILRALSASLELGLLVTITLDTLGDLTGRPGTVVLVGTANNGRRSLLLNAGYYGPR